MTPEPALWNCRSRGLASGGTSKNRRKKGSSINGLCCPPCSLIVPRVAMLTKEGDTRLTIGASDGIGAASGTAAGDPARTAGAARKVAATAIAASLKRKFMRHPLLSVSPLLNGGMGPGEILARLHASSLVDSRCYTQECAPAGLLGSFYGDPVRLHLGNLRNCDFQHTVDELRLDVLDIGGLRQAEAAQKLTRGALDSTIAVARLAVCIHTLSFDAQHALIGGDLHRLRVHAGQVNMQHELIRFLVDVDRRQPSAGIRGRRQRRAEQTIDILLEPGHKRPRLITYDSHGHSLIDKKCDDI